jgi:glucose/mannose-6-phosphate isomerase
MLDDIKTYEKQDPQEVSYGVEHLPEQIRIAWDGTREVKVPVGHKKCDRIVIAGMGGSALGPDIIQRALFSSLKVSLEVVRGYELPKYTNSKTLVILSSFSGNTEEIVSASKDAKAKKAKCMVITTGGKLKAFAKRVNCPLYTFAPGNLAKEPRLGVGFSFAGVLGLLERAGYIKLGERQVRGMTKAMSDVIDTCSLEINEDQNPAKIVAQELQDRSILLVASQHLLGNAHTLSNQINESAKQYSRHVELPEMNHHLMEGLSFPKGNFKNFSVLMIKSKLYHSRIQKRYDITADVFEKQGGKVIDYEVRGKTVLEECAELLQFGSFLSYYLGILNKVDLVAIPHVSYFKEKMKKK